MLAEKSTSEICRDIWPCGVFGLWVGPWLNNEYTFSPVIFDLKFESRGKLLNLEIDGGEPVVKI